MRLFVALLPPPEALAEVEAAVAPCRTAWPELRWTAAEHWHITLAFLGEVEERVLDGLQARLARVAARHAPVDLAFGAAGRFGDRVLWLGVDGPRERLARLAGAVAAQAAKAGAGRPDRKPYHPHLTLARVRHQADLRPVVGELAGFSGRPWRAESMHLVRSHLGPPLRYEPLASWSLGTPG